MSDEKLGTGIQTPNLILFLADPQMDYGSYMLFDGLTKIFGDTNVITYPYVKSWYGLVHDDYILDDGKRGCTVPPQFVRARERNEWSFEQIVRNIEKFAVTVISSPRTYAKSAARDFRKVFQNRLPPVIFCDHEDSTDIRYDLINEFKPVVSFKRELLQDLSHNKIYPIPFSSIVDEPDNSIKDIDVFFLVGCTSIIRKRIRDILLSDPQLKKYNIIAGADDLQKKIGYREYLKLIARSKINITARGHGYETVRRFEVASFTGFQLGDYIPILTPNDFTDGVNKVFFKNDLSDLVEKIIYYLEHNEERERIGKAGYEHCMQYHTSMKRAEYVLRILKENL